MSEMKAVLLSASAPSFEQEQRFTEFIHREYGPDVSLEWVQDNSIVNGFQLKVGEKIYDWTREGLYEQLSRSVDKRKYAGKELIPLIKNALTDWEAEALPAEKGTVITVGDGIAHIKGLESAALYSAMMKRSSPEAVSEEPAERPAFRQEKLSWDVSLTRWVFQLTEKAISVQEHINRSKQRRRASSTGSRSGIL